MFTSSFSGSGPERAHVLRVKQWAHELLRPTADAHIMVTQVACPDIDCPDVESVVAVLRPGQPPARYKIFKALRDVTRDDLLAVVALKHAAPRLSSSESSK